MQTKDAAVHGLQMTEAYALAARVKVWKFSVQRHDPEAVRWLPGGQTQRLRPGLNTSVLPQARTATGTTPATSRPGCTTGRLAVKDTWKVWLSRPARERPEKPWPGPA